MANDKELILGIEEQKAIIDALLIGLESYGEIERICDAVLDANNLDDAAVYLQITRGAGPTRSHVPLGSMTPTVFAAASVCEPIERFVEPASICAVIRPDLRWALCQIKTVSLMGNILALLDADENGATEAILHRDGVVSEGAYTNVFAVIGNALVTPPVDDDPPILHGVMRAELLDAAVEVGLTAHVRPLSLAELRSADEVLISSSRRLVSAVVQLDGATIGNGAPGRASRALFQVLRQRIARSIGKATSSDAESAFDSASVSRTHA